MKMTTTLTAAMIFGTLSLSAGLVIANNLPTRGAVPFTAWDADNSGTIDAQEFAKIREQRQAAVKASDRQGKNMAAAPTFAQLDKDGNDLITAEELTSMQQRQGNKRGMGRGHSGAGYGKGQHKGPRYQAMDAETREKHDTFFAATTELRKEIAAKRAEKQAVMRSVNPDPDQAAQLTRDLLELRGKMKTQAEVAGISCSRGSGCGYGGLGGRGHGRGACM